MDVDEGGVDVPTNVPPSSPMDCSSLPSSSHNQLPRDNLREDRLASFNKKMLSLSVSRLYTTKLKAARQYDGNLWKPLFWDILKDVTSEWKCTSLEDSTAIAIVQGFSDDECKEWRDVVQKALHENNWIPLLALRV
jgi:hypothetical protein